MPDRFFLDADFQPGQQTQLTGPEANHLGRVMRKQAGDDVELFNGRGTAVIARVLSISKRAVELEMEEVFQPSVSVESGLWLAVAPPKGDRLRWMVEKLTELGVERFIPLQCERTVVNPGETKLEKLRQTVIAACKQCRRNTLMDIAEPAKLADLLESKGDRQILLAHPGGEPIGESRNSDIGNIVCIGPEGGFSPSEIELAGEHVAGFISLGSNVLRTETAAIAVSAVAAIGRHSL